MYTIDQKEFHTIERVIDFVELYIFSDNIFLIVSGIKTIFSGNRYYKYND
jgi:hypothetical protein